MKPYQLMGAIQMYEASGDECCRNYVLTSLAMLNDSEGTGQGLPEQDYLAYFFTLEQTGEEIYKQKIDQLISLNNWTLNYMPFIMAYETKYNRKEHYSRIVALFRDKGSFTGNDLVILIDTIEQMSEEIYEYYRELRDIFKAAVREKIHNYQDSSEFLELGYSILKACNLEVLQTEKYIGFVEAAWKTVSVNNNESSTGIVTMFKAQYAMCDMLPPL